MPRTSTQPASENQLIAMHEASLGAYEAARQEYTLLCEQTEAISLEYIRGNVDRFSVKVLAEQLVSARSVLNDAAKRVVYTKSFVM